MESQTESNTAIDIVPIRRALISVYNKDGLEPLARALHERGVEIISTGGTEKYLRSIGIPVISVSDVTHSPEIFDGRLKTLHPVVHGGLLFRRDIAKHIDEAKSNGITAIDLLVSNLYPFEETLAKPGATPAEIIEQIDIGGPAMLRSAAKNFQSVALLTSPNQYNKFMREFGERDGSTGIALRCDLAREGFELVAHYDRAIADYFNRDMGQAKASPTQLEISLPLISTLRYGENPHQSAALYGKEFDKICTKLWGKELSYNNILDLSSALGLIAEFLPSSYPIVAAIIKHTNPCGVAEGASPLDAFERAFTTDPESPFGGIIILNCEIDASLATRLNQFFSEVVLAPSFSVEALEILKKRKDRRLLQFNTDVLKSSLKSGNEIRSVIGGILSQTPDLELTTNSALTSVTTHTVTSEMEKGLIFALKIVKHLKSNAIAFCGAENGFSRTLAVGAGQTSRVESTRIAIEHAHRHGLDLTGSFVASDAFYPFADSMVAAADAGVIAVVQPGGSVRDEEVIKAAEERGIALVMTGMRHFKH